MRSTEKFYPHGIPPSEVSSAKMTSKFVREQSNSSDDTHRPLRVRRTKYKQYLDDDLLNTNQKAKSKIKREESHFRETSNHRNPSVREATLTEEEESLLREPQLTKSSPHRQVYLEHLRESSVEQEWVPKTEAVMSGALQDGKFKRAVLDDDKMSRFSDKTYEIQREFSPPIGSDQSRHVEFRSENSYAPTVLETESGRSFHGRDKPWRR